MNDRREITLEEIGKQRDAYENLLRDRFYTAKHIDMFQTARNNCFTLACFNEIEYRLLEESTQDEVVITIPIDLDNVFVELCDFFMSLDDIQFNAESYNYALETLKVEIDYK